MAKTIPTAWAVLPALLAGLLGSAAHADTQVRSTSYQYTADGQLSQQVLEPGRPNDCLQHNYSYDNFGNRTQASSAACAGATGATVLSASEPRTSSDSYDSTGRFVASSTNALGQSEAKAYDSRFGGLTKLTGPNGLITSWAYDSFGRKVRETLADGTYTTWVYQLCSETGANCPGTKVGQAAVQWVVTEQRYAANGALNGPHKRSYHDSLNRVVRIQTQGFDGAGVAAPLLWQDTEYNAQGQIERQSDIYASTATPVWRNYTYDALGRITSESHPDSAAAGGTATATTTYSYSALKTSVTNANGQTRTSLKNAQGQVVRITDALGNSVDYQYDAQGNLTQTDAAGSITTLSYDLRGHKIAMQDPAMGAWVYGYNAFGELVSQRDSLNQTTTLAYDKLGRLIKRSEPDLISEWSYDKKFDGTACGKGTGKLCEARTDNGYKRTHSYDALGRNHSTATVLDSAASPAVVSEAFDPNTGRVTRKTWPTGYQASYSYTALGYLQAVTGGGTNGFAATQSYQVLAMDAQGQVTQYKTGNNVTTVAGYDSQTQRLSTLTVTSDGQASGNVLNHAYTYDPIGNLLTRTDSTAGVGTSESYGYDSINRLRTATVVGGSVSPPSTTEVLYDARGNITYKSDVGRYWYDAARPNRMTNVTLETAPGATVPLSGTRALSYVFDDYAAGAQVLSGTTVGNGNLTYTVSQDSVNNRHTYRGETYTSFNMPQAITFGNIEGGQASTAERTLSFLYGPEHQRIKQNVALSSNGVSSYHNGNTWYLNGEDSLGLTYEKELRTDGTIEHRHYLRAAGQTFALYVSRSGSLNGLAASATSYLHKDHLGSISAITDESGAVVERLAYDPWGKRRNIQSQPGQPDPLDQLVGQRTERGYTEHEHLDEVGVIHMNGRIFDPLMGRFMSADPEIQEPLELKSFNRYSYVWNNPLGMTDPTGYWVSVSQGGSGWNDNSSPSSNPSGVTTSTYTDGSNAVWSGGSSGNSGSTTKTTQTVNQYGQPAGSTGSQAWHALTLGTRQAWNNLDAWWDSVEIFSFSKMLGRLKSGERLPGGPGNAATAGLALVGGVASGKTPPTVKEPVAGGTAALEVNGAAASAKQGADLSRHLGYLEKYGAGGVKELENGRIRYYGEVQPANKVGEMAGRRYVHEFDPATGRTRGWHETIDHAGNVRQVRPELNNGSKTHYQFDRNGNYSGSW